jgi:hypothetical protein
MPDWPHRPEAPNGTSAPYGMGRAGVIGGVTWAQSGQARCHSGAHARAAISAAISVPVHAAQCRSCAGRSCVMVGWPTGLEPVTFGAQSEDDGSVLRFGRGVVETALPDPEVVVQHAALALAARIRLSGGPGRHAPVDPRLAMAPVRELEPRPGAPLQPVGPAARGSQC